MNICNIISLVIAGISLIFTIITTVRFQKLDMALKKNELDKNIQEKENLLKADIEANVVQGLRSQGNRLIFYNRGLADAENISFDITSDNEDQIQLQINNAYLPYPKLIPQQSFEIHYFNFSHKPHHTIKITWDDAYGKHREKEMVIDL